MRCNRRCFASFSGLFSGYLTYLLRFLDTAPFFVVSQQQRYPVARMTWWSVDRWRCSTGRKRPWHLPALPCRSFGIEPSSTSELCTSSCADLCAPVSPGPGVGSCPSLPVPHPLWVFSWVCYVCWGGSRVVLLLVVALMCHHSTHNSAVPPPVAQESWSAAGSTPSNDCFRISS